MYPKSPTSSVTSLPTDSSIQPEQTVSDQWQIAPNVSQIVSNASNVPETDDSLTVPSSIHRDRLALLDLTSSPPLSSPFLTSQEPAIKEPVSLTPLSISAQSNEAYVPNMTYIQPISPKALKSNVAMFRPVAPINGRMSRTHSTDNSNGKSA